MTSNSYTFRPASGALGAYVEGIDLATDMNPEVGADLERALGDYGVLFFRDQTFTPEQHVAIAEDVGAINVNRFFAAVDGHPKIAQVLKEPDQNANIGGDWHTDHSYDQIPAMGSMLVARETPPIGGDTLFSSMYMAYEALSDGMKEMLGRMKAVHSSRQAFGSEAKYVKEGSDLAGRLGNNDAATQDAVHPVIISHPVSGRKALYVNRAFTVRFDGWTAEESRPLLQYLYDHGKRPEFTCRFEWRDGSVALWDNRATWHCALNDYQGHRRLMHRITIEGEALAA